MPMEMDPTSKPTTVGDLMEQDATFFDDSQDTPVGNSQEDGLDWNLGSQKESQKETLMDKH